MNRETSFKFVFIIILILIIYGIKRKSYSNIDLDKFSEIKVEKVIDGDTIYSNKNEKIRIIGINTPETGKKQEKLGKEAKKFAEKVLKGRKVYLEKDLDKTDQYGRELRYVWLDLPVKFSRKEIVTKNYSAIIIAKGLARPYTFKPNVKYEKIFKDLAKKALNKKIGMWKYGDEGTTRGDKLN